MQLEQGLAIIELLMVIDAEEEQLFSELSKNYLMYDLCAQMTIELVSIWCDVSKIMEDYCNGTR